MTKNKVGYHHYKIEVLDAAAHLFQVTLTINEALRQQKVTLPSWLPGSYMVRDFARHIISLTATDKFNKPISIIKLDKATWQLNDVTGQVKLVYCVYAWDLSVRGAHLDQTHAFFNGSSLFLEVTEQSELPCLVSVEKPDQPFAKDWRVGTSMATAEPRKFSNAAVRYGFGDYWSENYDDLIDHPFEIADFSLISFDVNKIPHDLIIYGKHHADLSRIADDLTKICEFQIKMFGALPSDVKRYVFLVAAFGDAYGGLEHRSSTALHCSRDELPNKHDKTLSDGYANFLTLCSHEYFHTWHIKKLKPKAFQPYDLSMESYTQQLWIFEGFTSYYEDLIVMQSGVFNQEDYLKLVAKAVTRVYRGKGRLLQSVAESSFDAWTRFYKQDTNAPNAIVSYYAKGKLIALCLDLLIRKHTNNKLSLAKILSDLWQSHGAEQRGLKEGELEAILINQYELPLETFFSESVYGTDDLPLQELLKQAGVELSWHAVSNYKVLVGNQDNNSRLNLGATTKSSPLGVHLVAVYTDGNAHRAGLSTGDVVIAINSIKASVSNLDDTLASYSIGDEVAVHYFRRDELFEQTMVLQAAEKNTACLTIIKDHDASEKTIQWI